MEKFKKNLFRSLFCFILVVVFKANCGELSEFNKKLAKDIETQGIDSNLKLLKERQAVEFSKLDGVKKPTLSHTQELFDLMYFYAVAMAAAPNESLSKIDDSWKKLLIFIKKNNFNLNQIQTERVRTIRFIDKLKTTPEIKIKIKNKFLSHIPFELINKSPAQKLILCDILYRWHDFETGQKCNNEMIRANTPFLVQWPKTTKKLFAKMKLHLILVTVDSNTIMQYVAKDENLGDISEGHSSLVKQLLSAYTERLQNKNQGALNRLTTLLKLSEKKSNPFIDYIHLEMAYNFFQLKHFSESKKSILKVNKKNKYAWYKSQKILMSIYAVEGKWDLLSQALKAYPRYPELDNYNSSLLCDLTFCYTLKLQKMKPDSECKRKSVLYAERGAIVSSGATKALARIMELSDQAALTSENIAELEKALIRPEVIHTPFLKKTLEVYIATNAVNKKSLKK